jgi:lipopolysaccharide/colanic/teichoic acid biosynthesis glycosyltransferase
LAASVSRADVGSFIPGGKRVFDLVLLCAIMLLAGPIMLLAALAIRLVDGSPILFRQRRIGLNGKWFELLKFRTMWPLASDASHRTYVNRWIREGRAFGASAPSALYKIANDPRVTRLGAMLRRFSIDELPQLLNVLRGDMSVIGPRPAIPYEVEMYRDWHRRRLHALPGLTGLWQVSGRNRLSFDEMVRLDIEYIEHRSLAHDLAILARTPLAILQGDGR